MTHSEHISTLLDLFYSGESTPQQAAELTEYFRLTPPEDIPADLMADRELFLAIADESESAAPIPDGLEERLRAHIATLERNSGTAAPRPRRRIALLRRAAAVAASVAVMAIAVTAALMSRLDVPDSESAIAEMRHVTDVDEAARCLRLTDRLLAKGFGKARSACDNTRTCIENVNTKVLNLLNNNIQ